MRHPVCMAKKSSLETRIRKTISPPPGAKIGPGDGPRPGADVRKSLQMEDMKMPSAFDFAPFRRSTVGFDRLFELLESSASGQSQENYPPFDLVKVGENQFRISLAVA